jgi:tryptophanyl-tRNA synthetase
MTALSKRPVGKTLVFSGIQPSGHVHLGNYLGAISRFADLGAEYDQALYCIVDLHAITVPYNPQQLKEHTRCVAAVFLACGLQPKRDILFNQSQVSAHAELAWILGCVARMGWLNRMTQFKDKTADDREGASLGLYAYPVLMAADILLYGATHVPVGEDQLQHLELARAIAQKFNRDFKTDLFPEPKALIRKPFPRIMSLRDGTCKMSKSDPSDYGRINLTDSADLIAKKIRKARTDRLPMPDSVHACGERPEILNLIKIFSALSGQTVSSVLEAYQGQSLSSFKEALTEVLISVIVPLGEKIQDYLTDKNYCDAVLEEGAHRARLYAESTSRRVKEVMGFLLS